MIAVKLPSPLRRHVGGVARLDLPGSTVAECLEAMERRFPGVSAELRDGDGTLAPAVNLYVNGQDVRYLAGLETPVQDGDEITVLMPVAGGRGDTETRRRGDHSPALRALTARSLPSSLPEGEGLSEG